MHLHSLKVNITVVINIVLVIIIFFVDIIIITVPLHSPNDNICIVINVLIFLLIVTSVTLILLCRTSIFLMKCSSSSMFSAFTILEIDLLNSNIPNGDKAREIFPHVRMFPNSLYVAQFFFSQNPNYLPLTTTASGPHIPQCFLACCSI